LPENPRASALWLAGTSAADAIDVFMFSPCFLKTQELTGLNKTIKPAQYFHTILALSIDEC
jgi:hypothetical protein